MKTQPNTLPRLLVLTTLLFAVSPTINPRADAVEFRLSSECTSNKLILFWSGAPAIELQQATNPANPFWLDVPGSKGMSFREIPMTNPMAFFRLVDKDPTGDIDADGLDEFTETNGWTIFIDTHGYGTDGLVERNVTSDPNLGDTDGDGIDDFWEWMIGTDPRATDTDGDGLSDAEEWFKWHTSPTSVDTDSDARGPNHSLPPKAQFFDGNELRLLHTSPTLEDTDGDGRTDYEEYDQPGRSPLVAQLPDVVVELVDAVDIRLDVQYAEEVGQTHEYGGELTTSDTTGQETSDATTKSWSVEAGAEYTFGGLGWGGLKVSVKGTYGQSKTYTTTKSSSQTVENSHSDYTTDSRTRTETSASGSMSAGIRLVNTGPITYTLSDFGLAVRYGSPNGTFKTLATLVPALGANGITLAPGDSTPILQVQAKDLNASRVKEFMARPNSLYLEPAFYELQNAEGLNFDFLEEVTRWRTARVEIDYGNGTNEAYRVATNVERNEDGSYAGITMGNVMSNLLHIPFQTTNIQAFVPTNATNRRVLYSVRNHGTTSVTNGFWMVGLSAARTTQTNPNFEDIVLQAGDEILLTFIRDDDGDGLFAPEEQHYGTVETPTSDSPAPTDSDGDGLSDVFEARTGWDVIVLSRTNHVYSDPRQADQDGDGWTDAQESAHGTDPTKADTDDDGIIDRYDAFPLVPAKVLRVKADAPAPGNGATWATALTNLQDALSLARTGAANGDPDDDVAEIWVAAGVYKPTTTTNYRNASFQLVNTTAIYGGFAGGETKLSQRNPDPLSNDTRLSGDLLGNDTSTPWDNPATFTNDNSYTVCTADSSIGDGTVLDGFTITGGSKLVDYGGGMVSFGRPKLRNLFFRANYSINGAGFFVWLPTATAEPYVISDCLFLQNGAGAGGAGGMLLEGQLGAPSPQVFVVSNCHFYANAGTGDGGGLVVGQGTFEINDCTFAWNTSSGRGGGMEVLRPATARISRCEFLGNSATSGGAGLYMSDFLSQPGPLKVEVVQSVFWGNSTPGWGGAIWAGVNNLPDKRLYILNSTIVSNTATLGAIITLDYGAGWIENSILWGSTNRLIGGSTLVVRTTCLPEASSYPGNGNINADPLFVDSFGGNLRLKSGSPCIDRGNNFMDYHPTIPGWQPLPDTDLDGNWRIMDGNNDAIPKADMGAYERQGP